jgi:cyclopropane-fatty-acyl-phospholipid synthase
MALRYLSRIRQGELTIEDLSGQEKTFGSKKHEKDRTASITIMDNRFYRRTLLKGEIGLGESYTAGEWKSADLPQFLSLLSDNLTQIQDHKHRMSTLGRALEHVRHALRPNTLRGSRNNITEHYDLSNDFFSVFLDSTMTYSCALFENPDDDLETAQINKIRSVIQKADICKGNHVLEIGCGWGSFAMEAARTRDCRITGITISKNQLEMARGRVRERGLEDRIALELRDYRQIKGKYDAIVSIEMLEAVGHANLVRYFSAIEDALKPGRLAVIQVITIPDERYNSYRRNPDWIRKHIFPGGHLPSLAALKEAAANTGSLSIRELTDIGDHYARTLAMWRERLMQNRDRIVSLGYDDAFIRKWEYYFAYCEAGFATGALHDYQMVLEKTGEEKGS